MTVSAKASIPPSALVALGGDGTISIKGKALNLPEPKRAILAFLVKRLNTIVTKQEILDHLTGIDLISMLKRDVYEYLHALQRTLAIREAGPSLALWSIERSGFILSVNTSESRPLYQTLGLPHPKERWTPGRKELVVSAIRLGKLTLEDALKMYPNTGREEVLSWMARFERSGREGLKASINPRWL